MKTLETGLWLTKNRGVFKTILILFLLIISISAWLYTFYGFGNYLIFGMNADSQMARAIAQSTGVSQAYLNQFLPQNIILSPAGFLTNNNKYDLYIQVSNPNTQWWGNIVYCFQRLDGEQSCGKTFILPGEKKYIVSLAQSFNAEPNDLKFSYTISHWNKINKHNISNWSSYQTSHLNLVVSNQTFTPASTNSVSEKIGFNSLGFTVTNNSAYSYWQMPLTIVLMNNGKIVYLDRYLADNLTSQENRNIQITWPGAIGDITSVSILPDVNILDQSVYQKPQ